MYISLKASDVSFVVTDEKSEVVLAYNVKDYSLTAKPEKLIAAIGEVMATIMKTAEENC